MCMCVYFLLAAFPASFPVANQGNLIPIAFQPPHQRVSLRFQDVVTPYRRSIVHILPSKETG